MSKKNSSIYHIENYIQMQKLNSTVKFCFNNAELTFPRRKNQDTPYHRNKMGH